MVRGFAGASVLVDDDLGLALAPALTPTGLVPVPSFFSACNGVYARLDLLGDGFDAGEIGYGTTNVDITMATRRALTQVARDQLLHLDVGFDGLTVSSPDETSRERPVRMPARWVPALGNAAAMHAGLVARVHLDATAARSFVAGLPSAAGKSRSGWVTHVVFAGLDQAVLVKVSSLLTIARGA